MKVIRYLAAALLLVTGVLHVISAIKVPPEKNAIPMLIFGIIYFTVGVLLFFKVKYSSLAGLAFPAIGLGSGFFVLGYQNWTPMLTLLYGIDVVIVICCVVLVLKKSTKAVAPA